VKEKAAGGKLPRKELRAFVRRNTSPNKAKRKYLAKLRALRREGVDEGIDPKVLAFLGSGVRREFRRLSRRPADDGARREKAESAELSGLG
jgi:hypothetical protein